MQAQYLEPVDLLTSRAIRDRTITNEDSTVATLSVNPRTERRSECRLTPHYPSLAE